jgi:hypothetical protein
VLCGQELERCMENIQNYPLFDTEYKIAANYIPILALRAFAHAEVYKEKKPSRLIREYYVKILQANLANHIKQQISISKSKTTACLDAKLSPPASSMNLT